MWLISYQAHERSSASSIAPTMWFPPTLAQGQSSPRVHILDVSIANATALDFAVSDAQFEF